MVSPLKIKPAPYYLMTNGLPHQNVSRRIVLDRIEASGLQKHYLGQN